ncbi:MAG: hypothetical protein AAF702_31315 [Chloroflexota bacterium]
MITATIRDIAIIIIAIQSILIGILIAVLIWQIWRLVNTLQTEIKPIIEETRETVQTVKGTASFIGSNIVEPVAKTSGYMAGARQTVRQLAGLSRSSKKQSTK